MDISIQYITSFGVQEKSLRRVYNVTMFAFCISFSSLCQQSYRSIVTDMRCVFEGFTPLWHKTFLAPVNIVRSAQMPTPTQLQLYAQGLLCFARFCLKS